MVTVETVVVEPTVVAQPAVVINGEPLSPGNPQAWKVDTCGKCCDCGPSCLMAWFCTCFPLGQLASKAKNNGMPIADWMTFQNVVLATIAVRVLDLILSAVGISLNLSWWFMGCIIFTLRKVVRRHHNIPGEDCEDCLLSFCCVPCTVTQMVHQMWANPDQAPGCTFDESPAMLV